MFYEKLAESTAEKQYKARIALIRASQGGNESVSNAAANEYAAALRASGYDVDEIDLKDVPFADEWDDKFKNEHRARLKRSQATVFATPVYNWGPSARLNAYIQNSVKAGQDPYRPYAVLGAAGSSRAQGYLHGLQNMVAMEDKGINVGAPLVATGDDMMWSGETVKGVRAGYKKRLAEHAAILGRLAEGRHEKRAAINIRLPSLNNKTRADDMRDYFKERAHMSDEEVISEYARRNELRGRIGGALLGGAMGSGLLAAGLGLREIGTGAGTGEMSGKYDGSTGSVRARVARGIIGAGIGTYLGGRYGRDHAYHVSDAALPILRKEYETKKRRKLR